MSSFGGETCRQTGRQTDILSFYALRVQTNNNFINIHIYTYTHTHTSELQLASLSSICVKHWK